jgi:hypothetical protein
MPVPNPSTKRRRPRVSIRRQRFALLFVFLLLSIVIYPYAENSRFGFYAFRIFGSAVTLLTVYAVAFRRHLIVLVLCLAVPALLQRVMIAPLDTGVVAILNRVLSLTFDVTVLAIIYRHVYADHRPTSETVFGALCVYLLLGFSFASIYSLITSLQPGAFYLDPAVNVHHTPDRFDFIYYSFGTMTELGAPGITAVSREIRSISLIEAVLGILYLAVLISRLMSAYRGTTYAEARQTDRSTAELHVGSSKQSERRAPKGSPL